MEPRNPDPEAGRQEEIAEQLVQELVRQGLTDSAIMRIFRNPLAGGPHSFYKVMGEEWLRSMVSRVRRQVA